MGLSSGGHYSGGGGGGQYSGGGGQYSGGGGGGGGSGGYGGGHQEMRSSPNDSFNQYEASWQQSQPSVKTSWPYCETCDQSFPTVGALSQVGACLQLSRVMVATWLEEEQSINQSINQSITPFYRYAIVYYLYNYHRLTVGC